ncbi:MAG: hypothetical protein PQJ58_01035 [Spirochaetales bacterium]|nr:hypothetical protein [Spirochaetales bacterium]
MEINFKMTAEESIRLYQFLSSEYTSLDISMKELLHKLEKEIFSTYTISQIESLQIKSREPSD